MKISILTIGTRGDVQPYISLGKALKARGHEVLLSAPENFAPWVTEHGLAFRSVGVDMEAFLQSPEAKKVMSGNPLSMIKLWRKTIVPMVRDGLDAAWNAAQDADIIIFHPKVSGAIDIAEATGATVICASPIPIFPTGAFPFFALPGNYGAWLNRISYKPLSISRLIFSKMVNQWRREVLGLGKGAAFMPIDGFKRGTVRRICAVSPMVIPRADKYREDFHATGYWFLDEGIDWQPDAKLQTFLEAGTPPIYIGFGSMIVQNPEQLFKKILEGVRQAKVRAIIASGWSEFKNIDSPDTVYKIDKAPHDALFKHVTAVVHHGGAGTTAAGLRAGLPTLICPFAFDQPFWGCRISSLECGPKPQSLKRLKAERFAQGLVDLTQTESYRIRARKIAQSIKNEDGIARAIEVIEATAL